MISKGLEHVVKLNAAFPNINWYHAGRDRVSGTFGLFRVNIVWFLTDYGDGVYRGDGSGYLVRVGIDSDYNGPEGLQVAVCVGSKDAEADPVPMVWQAVADVQKKLEKPFKFWTDVSNSLALIGAGGKTEVPNA